MKTGQMIDGMYFTHSECTEKTHTVADAVRAAQIAIDGRFGPDPKPPTDFDTLMDGWMPVDLGLLKGRWLGERITLVELNELSEMLSSTTIGRAYLDEDEWDEHTTFEFGHDDAQDEAGP